MNYPEKNFARFYRQLGIACAHYMAGLLNFTVCSAKVSRYDLSTYLPDAGATSRTTPIPMSTCTLCGIVFSCAMADNTPGACWCTTLPAAVPLPQEAAGCWCRACLTSHIAQLTPPPQLAKNPEPKK